MTSIFHFHFSTQYTLMLDHGFTILKTLLNWWDVFSCPDFIPIWSIGIHASKDFILEFIVGPMNKTQQLSNAMMFNKGLYKQEINRDLYCCCTLLCTSVEVRRATRVACIGHQLLKLFHCTTKHQKKMAWVYSKRIMYSFCNIFKTQRHENQRGTWIYGLYTLCALYR